MLGWLEVIRGSNKKGRRRKTRLKGNQGGGDKVERQLGRAKGKLDGMYPLMNPSSPDDSFLQENISR
jgi:hypothetical protein